MTDVHQSVFPGLQYRDARAAIGWLGSLRLEGTPLQGEDGSSCTPSFAGQSFVSWAGAEDDRASAPRRQGWI